LLLLVWTGLFMTTLEASIVNIGLWPLFFAERRMRSGS
jgi:hypothetical protein